MVITLLENTMLWNSFWNTEHLHMWIQEFKECQIMFTCNNIPYISCVVLIVNTSHTLIIDVLDLWYVCKTRLRPDVSIITELRSKWPNR